MNESIIGVSVCYNNDSLFIEYSFKRERENEKE